MKTLKFKEELCADPIAVDYGTVTNYSSERHILINGILTHLVSTLKENSYDSDKMKESIASLIGRFWNDSQLRHSRIEVDALHAMSCDLKESETDLTDDLTYVFNYIKVVPVYED